ncbi:HD domain-containing protein [Tissierella sp. MSJ-40]|uniref:HD domain-containing protein n=1 Tax=Tissierella simiarum TaxID=2841534 RepID=A0ABS6EAY6_9FIRM|nr:HD-GYP domain-containing protein [Tissierella simiarum]MBU5440077.1 HD domain-containing protein [Tissierella simiarum]
MAVISIDDLRPGMVVDRNIENFQTGAILVAKGTVLNKRIISQLMNLGIEQVAIYMDNNGSIDEPINNLSVKYKFLSNKLDRIFNDVKYSKKVILSEISSEVDQLITEITKENNVIGRIKQLEEKDDYTFNHSLNVCMLAIMVGKWLNYSKKDLKQVALTGLFHDIGKLKIPDHIINKPDKLTMEEYEIVKKHSIYSYNILSGTVGISKNILMGVLQHHEREDGSGYPQGLKGNKIHEFAKIIAICDVYDAMTSNRLFKKKESPLLVAEYLNNESFNSLNPLITRVFLDNISRFYVGNKVLLSNGEIGEIVYVHPQQPTKTIVKSDSSFINFLEYQDVKIIDILK